MFNFFKSKKINLDEIVDCPKNVNFDKRFIFIHIPKCAGTSILTALEMPEPSHTTADQYKDILGKYYELFHKFVVVRNPIDRFISCYNYARMETSDYHSAINPSSSKYGKHLDYDLLANANINECVQFLMEDKLIHDKGWNHWHPQAKWVLDHSGKNIVNSIIKLENITNDLQKLNSKLNLKLHLEHKNRSSKQQTVSDLTIESVKLLKKYYAIDFKTFNYE